MNIWSSDVHLIGVVMLINKGLLIVGKKGSGKTIFAQYVKEMHFKIYEMGDVVRRNMKERGIELTNENLRNFMIKEREQYGTDIFAKRVVEQIKKDMENGDIRKKDIIIIVGIRNIREILYFSKFIKNMLIIEIRARDELRFERIKQRKKEAEPIDYGQFLKQEEKERQVGIEEALLKADIVIENNDDLNTFKKKIKNILNFIV